MYGFRRVESITNKFTPHNMVENLPNSRCIMHEKHKQPPGTERKGEKRPESNRITWENTTKLTPQNAGDNTHSRHTTQHMGKMTRLQINLKFFSCFKE